MNHDQNAIKDIVFAQNYAKRISLAVHAQVMNFAQSVTHQMLSVHPEGSPEYMAVVQALEKTGLMIVSTIREMSPNSKAEASLHADAEGKSESERASDFDRRATARPQPVASAVFKGPWAKR